MSDLRTRIAAVLYRLWRERFPRSSLWEQLAADEREPWLTDADAVIRELRMEREFSIGNDEDGRVLWLDSEKPITPRPGETVEVRWISQWSIRE